MRIALLTHQFPGVRLGGIGAYTLQAAAAMAAAGHDVHVFTLALPADVRAGATGAFTLHEVPDLAARVAAGTLPGPLAGATQAAGEAVYRAAIGAALCGEVRRVHAAAPLDVVEAAEYESLALPLMVDPLPTAGGRVPVVTHVHSGSAIRRVGNGLPATDDALAFEALEFAAILAADALCAATDTVVADTRRLVPVDAPVTKIPLPFTFDETRVPAPADPAGPILFIGRLEALKGIEVLTHALKTFLPETPAARVQLAGPDTNTAAGNTSMAAWVRRELGPLAARVEFLGEQGRGQLEALLARAAFVAVPSLFDNFPYVVCEALAAGRGVVVSNGIGATELAGDAGVTFARGDAGSLARAMAGLHRDPARVRALGAAAFRRACGVLSSRVTVPARIGFYKDTIARARATPRRGFIECVSKMPAGTLAALAPALLRMTAALAGELLPSTVTPGSRLLELCRRHERETGAKARVYLYGAGRHTARLLTERHLWEGAGHATAGLIDDHPRFAEAKAHLGLPVQPLARFVADARAGAGTLVVLSTDTFEEQFWEQTRGLRGAGVAVRKLYGA